ncbi:GTP-binding protein [Streptomyces sp. Je 1-4]|uniref:GTP-binding protein n=1 Tax=Streptomyces TaxID=1883 RepID=UPI0021D97334|nr:MULTISPECIES: GTP-binding protein [unclassified Streptomyces]UYB43987.1 GTP-binding protein [Streptomyces sp. Je 1-4]UZQ40415.1 GTP-binding protein [Streptomyces sp. Je 1-4] [Streptomyces sp. Je 1-4 4N24]UZQ47832.1 GTP-binding protein [Streptomyces sp. Je 1-4] [Streptomyces sp. Je 1-4 4N24_ara]
MSSAMPKGLLSAVVGNTPEARGAVVNQAMRLSPHTVVLAVSIQHTTEGEYPTVQRFVSGNDPRLRDTAPLSATGNPAVILRQDLLSLKRAAGRPHVTLALPTELDVLPFLVELWRTRIGSSSLEDHYEPAPILVGVDPASFVADIGCVHRTVRLWNESARNDPLTPAEVAARQIEAADALVFPGPATSNGHRAAGVAALASQLNSHALLVRPKGADDAEVELPPSLVQPAAHGIADEWRSRLEPVTVPRSRRSSDQGVNSVLWRARRPLHPERLADALGTVMRGVVRSRGHLWLSSRPDSVVTWCSAGPHLELREAGFWLEAGAQHAWDAVSPQRRTLASWFWHDYYGERRNEITFTGIDLDAQRIRSTLAAALLTDAELSLGRDGWISTPDPLLSDGDPP